MLSKLQHKKDFSWLDSVLDHHQGVWINRFSRLAEPLHEDWSSLEQTPLPLQQRLEFADYLNNK